MEFMNRSARPVSAESHTEGGSKKKSALGKGARLLTVVLLTAAALLILATSFYLAFGGPKNEQTYVKGKSFQAVFLNGGQVYFGKIRSLNNKYLTMDNIYYLRVNQQVQPNQSGQQQQDISLAKLGCELHGPEDTMVINREQVTFWENLKSDGQVVKAISQYVQANPNGQTCSTNSNSSSTPTPTPTPPTTPTPPASNKKP